MSLSTLWYSIHSYRHLFQKPADIFSTHEGLLLRFRSDDTLVSKGFSVAYEAVDKSYGEEEEEEEM